MWGNVGRSGGGTLHCVGGGSSAVSHQKPDIGFSISKWGHPVFGGQYMGDLDVPLKRDKCPFEFLFSYQMDRCSKLTRAICQRSAQQCKRWFFWSTRALYLPHVWVMGFRWGDGDSSKAITWRVVALDTSFYISDTYFGFLQFPTFCIWKPRSRAGGALITETQGRIQTPHLSLGNPPCTPSLCICVRTKWCE